MPKLPVISGQILVAALMKRGFYVADQHGSHVKLKRQISGATLIVIVPMHKEVAQGTLRSILKQAKLTEEEFRKLVRN